MADIHVRRLDRGPALLIESAELLVQHFLRHDPSAWPGGFDDLAGKGDPYRITRADITAINTTMRARSPYAVWEPILDTEEPLAWLLALDPLWDLVTVPEELWDTMIRGPLADALAAVIGPGRGLSVGTKVLHLKRPRMFPVLDSLVLQRLGVTAGVPVMRVIEHLREEGIRNAAGLREIQASIAPRERSLMRLLDILIWTSHPAAGIEPSMTSWEHRLLRIESSDPPVAVPDEPEAPPPSLPSPRRLGRMTFEEAWERVERCGGCHVVSSRGTEYTVFARIVRGRKALVATRPKAAIYVHEDCFGDDLTCHGTRAGGIYHGHPSIWDC